MRLLLLLALIGCGEPPPPELSVDLERVTVEGVGLTELVVHDEAGLVLARRAGDGDVLSARHGAEPGAPLRVAVSTDGGSVWLDGFVPPEPGPIQVELDLPAGQGAAPLRDEHAFTAVEGVAVRASLAVTAREPGTLEIRLGRQVLDLTTTVPSERRVVFVDVPTDGVSDLHVGPLHATLRPTLLSRAEARASLQLEGSDFPADGTGRPEVTRPAGRVTLPSPWWRASLRRIGLGTRARDPYGPWAFQALTLRNASERPLNVAVRARVLDADGSPADAFRPRLRDQTGQTGDISGLLRVPARGEATATLPFFVDAAGLPEGASAWTREVSVVPLGSSEPLWVHREPLQVRQGSTWISAAFALALLGGAAGLLLLGLRLRSWLAASRTVDLVTVAVFATLSFLVSGASTLVAAAVAAVLGPFAIFVTNLLDDALRYALLATLVVLLPRPGVAALSVILVWLMRGVALGAFTPIDAVTVGAQVFWLEAALWAFGVTRGEPRPPRWLPLAGAFGLASALTTVTGLAVAMVLYRLYYAGWYVAAVLAGPGLIYVWIACALAVGFAASLRRVEA